MPEAPHPESRNGSAAVVSPSAEEPGKKDGQPARPSVVISAGKSEQ
jgi:hypothetical protein